MLNHLWAEQYNTVNSIPPNRFKSLQIAMRAQLINEFLFFCPNNNYNYNFSQHQFVKEGISLFTQLLNAQTMPKNKYSLQIAMQSELI